MNKTKVLKFIIISLAIVFSTNIYTFIADENKNVSVIDESECLICNIGEVDERLVKKIQDSYLMIPENVRNHFEGSGWKVFVTTENLGQKYFGRKMSILALTVTEEKAIYIDDREKAVRSVIHEMGHYIDYGFGFISSTDEFSSIFREEAEKFRSIHYTHINNTCTELEYFAEAYIEIVMAPEMIIENCPRTYGFIMECARQLQK